MRRGRLRANFLRFPSRRSSVRAICEPQGLSAFAFADGDRLRGRLMPGRVLPRSLGGGGFAAAVAVRKARSG